MKAKTKNRRARPFLVKPMDHWMKHYDKQAKQQGWSLFDCDGGSADGHIRIQRLDEAEEGERQLASDLVAMEIVASNALKGDKLSLVALYFDGRLTDGEVDLPKSLRP